MGVPLIPYETRRRMEDFNGAPRHFGAELHLRESGCGER